LREFASVAGMSATARWQPRHQLNRRLLRARDAIDRSYASQLDIQRLARIALVIDFGIRDPFGNRIRIGQIAGE
jgi:hypothetical protein